MTGKLFQGFMLKRFRMAAVDPKRLGVLDGLHILPLVQTPRCQGEDLGKPTVSKRKRSDIKKAKSSLPSSALHGREGRVPRLFQKKNTNPEGLECFSKGLGWST